MSFILASHSAHSPHKRADSAIKNASAVSVEWRMHLIQQKNAMTGMREECERSQHLLKQVRNCTQELESIGS